MRFPFRASAYTLVFVLSVAVCTFARQSQFLGLQNATITGTVLDITGATVPNAKVILEGLNQPRSFVTGDNGFFSFDGVKPGTSVRIEVSAPDLKTWTSNEIVLQTPHCPPS